MNKEEQPIVINMPLDIRVIVTEKNSKPCIKLEKITTNIDVIKSIVSCALHENPIVIVPIFSNRIKSLGSLIEKGIIYQHTDGKYYFTI